ncbi:non-ribosomal peptide synthetase [Streptantibioticus silvisoli]|uniref:Amino acid adenylation domain-containing protein n=1 Tax=Streptantibioticus silvisoli TaxID=2705255 RepID=A0ABT6VW21_9ACTN|nr:non-ribosomal peptide synthetase [Streptantibioticus silvisoli]MDI5962224.1 amino acid adenylation domain-containing protein [Streptantibioticus silvisoli]
MTDHRSDYWRQALEGLEPLELPTDRRRTAGSGAPRASVTFDVPAGTTAALAATAVGRGGLPVALLAVFQLLLARYSGQDDIAVVTAAGPDTALVRTDLSGDPSFSGLLDRVAAAAAPAADHRGLPSAGPAGEFGTACDLPRTPVFVLRDAAGAPHPAPDRDTARPDLVWDLTRHDGALSGSLGYRADLFDRDTALRMAGHLGTLLAGAAADPHAALSAREMLTAAERRQILTEWRGPVGAYPDTATVHQLVEASARRHPDAVAVTRGAETLTYRQVNERANRLAHHLRSRHGAGPGTLVAVLLDRGPDLICALLGILKAGAAYVPLDPEHPADRIAYMVQDTATPLVVTHTDHAGLLPAATPRLLTDTGWPAGPATDPGPAATAHDLAYVIYTSGSTGRPKGVQLDHQGVVNYLHQCDRNYPPHAGHGTGTLLYSSVTFDLTVTALFLPLIQGLRITVPVPGPGRTVFDAAVETVLTGEPISFLKATPSHLEVLTAQLEHTGARHRIATVVAGGEDLTPALAHRVLSTSACGTVLVNEYGPTEGTVGNVVSMTREVAPDAERVPMGRPIDNTEVYVVDAARRPQPVGVPGELLLGGVNVARGYLNRPDLTEQRFVPHPFSDTPGARVYRTGDLVRWLPDGRLEYLGRIDDQVKLRGHRIELGEIEAALLAHPAVAAATVVVREDTPGDKRLAAYLVPAPGAAPTTADLRARLARDLPAYMLPARYVTLDRLPLTANGKVDRKALPVPDGRRPDLEAAYTAPRTPVEQAITAVWSDILGIEPVGVHDDFLALGGHSLLATRVASRLRADLGVEIPVRALFGASTPAALAAAVATLDTAGTAPVPRADRTGPLPLSFAQQRLWFLDQLEPGRSEYVLPVALRVRGPLETAVLESALGALVARHETLRTRFTADADGRPLQTVDAAYPVPVTVHDLRDAGDATARAEAARTLLAAEAARPFDLAADPMLRAAVARLADDDHHLLLTVHHIASDGWSEGVLARELREHYAAALEDREPDLPELPVAYADFAVWQRQWLTGERLDGQLDYWREQLAGIEPLELPTDHRRPPVRGSRGATHTFSVPADVTAALKAAAAERGASPFMALLSVFQLLLSKYSGQQDIAVGTPIAGRNRAEVEDLVGFFVNTLVLRTDLSGNPTFTELLDRVKDTALAAYDHQDLPFERIVEELAPERDLSRNPLFQTLFVLQNVPDGNDWALPGLTVEPAAVTTPEAQFDLTLYLTEAPDGSLDASLVYAADLLEPATAERLAGHFRTLLAAVGTTPGARLGDLEMLTPAERRQTLVEWNRTTAPYPDTKTVHQLVEEQAARRPDAVAVRHGDRETTYGELNERANRLAHHLRSRHGVGPDTLVAVCLERSAELFCAELAVLKAGGGYVPLAPDYPADRLSHMVSDSATPLVITDSGHAHLFDGSTLLLTDRDWPAAGDQPGTDPEPAAGPGHTAYIIYTSGSTGRPKGVQIQHDSMVNLVQWTLDHFPLETGDRVAMVAGVAFDVAAWELWRALADGATCCIPTESVRLTPTLLQRWLEDDGIRCTYLSPPMLEALAALSWGATTTLEYVHTAGDLLRLPAGVRLPFRIYNDYGPTETTVIMTFTEAEPGDPLPPIGRAIANTTLYVVDRYDRPVPVGVTGELLIGGVCVARGYLNQPELTGRKFIDYGVDGRTERVYRSGDLVKWRTDGQLEFVARVDNQVKIRGFRIELGEIEAALLTCPGVTAAVVIVREDTPGDKRLAAYLVADGPTAADLRAHLQQRLPDYMVPPAFVLLDRLPLTKNGKIDRRALPVPDTGRDDLESAYTAPRTPAEQAVTAIWSDVLGVATIGVDDNFFELGGHSLLAIQVVSRLRQDLGVELPVRALFTSSTPAALAAAVTEATPGTAAAPLPDEARPVPVPRDGGPLPLSFAQQRLWFLDQLDPERAEYALPFALRVTGTLDIPALETALTALCARHEVLRTRFVADDDGEPTQIVDAPAALTATVHDLRATADAAEREAAARRIIDTETARPADLARGPLLRADVVRLADDDQYLLLTLHHIVADGWSEGVLARELRACYAAALADRAADLPELPVQYADFAVWQRQWLTGDVLDRQLNYWREQLAAIEPLELPTDHRRPALRSGGSGTVGFTVPAGTADRLRATAADRGATLFMAMLSTFQILLAKYSRQEDIAVGTPIAGRNRAEIEDLVGFFVNTLVMRTDLSGDPTFTELLDRVKDTALAAYDHQDLPFERIVEELAPERDLSRNPFFQTMFLLRAAGADTWALPGASVEQVPVALRDAKFDLIVTVDDTDGDDLRATVEYRTDLFEPQTVERLAGHFATLLDAVGGTPQARLSQLDLLTAAERGQILGEWNDTAADYPTTATLHQLVEQCAARLPDAVAVDCAAGPLTYRELNERANRLAHHLRSRYGVGPDTLVAVCLDRGPDLVCAQLAVLKAGGAYAPLDPGYPTDRLAYMVHDTGTPVVVTDSGLAGRLPADTPHFLTDRDGEALRDLPAGDPEPVSTPDDLAYVIYTSGSTGRPKGALIQHRSAVDLVHWTFDGFAIVPGDRVALLAGVGFDAAAWELWPALAAGATCCVTDDNVRLTPPLLQQWLIDQGIRGTFLSTPMLEALAALPWDGTGGPEYIMTGGDLLRLPAGVRLPFRVHNVYGPTETTVLVTSTDVEPGDPLPPIGRPSANSLLWVVDRYDRPVPVGVPGELLIGGRGLARGYLNQPELTAAKFVPYELDGATHRVYRSGDLVKWRPDGMLEFVGRIDTQVKLRGFRIELGEIESTLLAHPGVTATTVVVREDTPGDKRLAGYVVPADPAAAPSVGQLRAHLQRHLPDHMVPAAFVVLDRLPLTPNGKTDRRALPVPDTGRPGLDSAYTAPRNRVEEAITAIWSDILGVQTIGVDDNFFELGGHSLLATQVTSRLRKALGIEIPVRTLFTAPTPAQLGTAMADIMMAAISAQFSRAS